MNPDAILEADHLVVDAIDDAEEIRDPLAGLTEKTAADPGAPFMPEALEALAALKRANRRARNAPYSLNSSGANSCRLLRHVWNSCAVPGAS